MKIKLEIELTEIEHFGCLHQDGFTIGNEQKKFLTYATTVPGALPYVLVHQGEFAGKIFKAAPAMFKAALVSAFLAGPEPAAEPAPEPERERRKIGFFGCPMCNPYECNCI